MGGRPIVVMGVFVADLAFVTPKLPAWGETVLGLSFKMGPGGKGSNQAIAAARLGGTVSFISKVGRDAFGDIARRTYAEEGVDTRFLFEFTSTPRAAPPSSSTRSRETTPSSSFPAHALILLSKRSTRRSRRSRMRRFS